MSFFKNFLPSERVIDNNDVDDEDTSVSIPSEQSGQKVKEYRDEANRSPWKFFDEFEYRPKSDNEGEFFNYFKSSTPNVERTLMLKLDILITLYSFIGYWSKYVDNYNLTNAYVSGMQEDLKMKGNDLVNTQIIFTVGSVIFTVPFIYVLPRYPSHYVLLVGESMWSLFTLVTFAAPNVKALKAFRFIVGAAETCFFPVVHHLLTSWFRPSEISKRAGFFYVGQYLGILTSSLLQGSIYSSLGGVNGLAGWQWVFIIEGVFSFVICLMGFFFAPGTPERCYSLFLSDDEIRFARKRMKENGTHFETDISSFFNKTTWTTILKSWHFWLFSIGNIGGFCSTNTVNGTFQLYLKSTNKYSVSELNYLVAIPPALGIIWVLGATIGADLLKKRFLMICFANLMNFIANIILSIWNVPQSAKWFAYYFSYWAWAQSPVFYPLQNDILRGDANIRSIEWTITYIIGLQASAWIPKLVWETTDAPEFSKGFPTAAAMGLLQSVCMIIGYFFYKRDERSKAEERGIVLFNSARNESPSRQLSASEVESLSEGVKSPEKFYEKQLSC